MTEIRNSYKSYLTKKELIATLKDCGFSYATVVSHTDSNGGRQHYLEKGQVESEKLPNFCYIEWEGDLTQLVKDRKIIFEDYYELFHEEPFIILRSLECLLLNSLAEEKY